MKILILYIPFLFFFNVLNGQIDSLSHYSLTQLDSIYQIKKVPQEQLPYVLALLQKGEKELNVQDTAFANILFKTGLVYQNLRDFKRATNYLLMAAEIQKVKIPQNKFYANTLNSLGQIFYTQGNAKETEKYWTQTLDILKVAVGEKDWNYASIMDNLGVLYKVIGNLEKAEALVVQSQQIRKEILGEKHPLYAKSFNNLGLIYTDKGEHLKAEEYFEKAIKLREEVLGKKHPDYAVSLYDLGTLYFLGSKYLKAEPLFLEALQIQKEVSGGNNAAYSGVLNNLANLYQAVGDYSKAEELYQQVLYIRKNTMGVKHPSYAGSLQNLGMLYKSTNRFTEAEALYLEALQIKEETLGKKHPEYGIALNNLGILYRSAGDYVKAEDFYLKAIEIWKEALGDKHPHYASALNNLGDLYRATGSYEKAETAFYEVLRIRKEILGDKSYGYAEVSNNIARLYLSTKNYPAADSFYLQSFSAYIANLSRNFTWLTERGRVAYWNKEKKFYLELNAFAANFADQYENAAGIAYRGNLVSKSLLLESARALEDAALTSKDSITVKIYNSLKEKRNGINNLIAAGGNKTILSRLENEADSLDKLLINKLGEYAASKHRFQLDWKDVRNGLNEYEAAIEFARYYNEKDSSYHYIALLLRPHYTCPKAIKLCLEKELEVIPAGKGFADLERLIWQPIDSFLIGVKTVYYSPDGILNNIPFTAFCSRGTEKVISTKEIKRGSIGKSSAQTSECVYLSDRYTLHQLSTTRYLAEGLKNNKINNSMLVFGGVNYDEIPTAGDTIAEVQLMEIEDYALTENIARSSNNQSRMEYLPGTQTELQNVQKIMHKKQWKIRAFSDENASENTFKSEIQKESPGVLHIATHGFAFPDIEEKKKGLGEDNKTYRDLDNPMARCGLLLAGANHSWTGNSKNVLSQTGEDAILTALEVSNLSLKNTKLVVLSACETGLGKIEGTEGTFGLKRGFKLAGVEQIIVSLWSVPDKETMELMDIFYNDLAKTRNAVISFEKAQKDMRKKYADRPDLWAGFVLVR